jgi:hypothetical protein
VTIERDPVVVPPADESAIGESRWIPALAVVAYLAVNVALKIWLSPQSASHVPWLVPGIEVLLLVALVTADPGNRAERRRWHRVALVLVCLLVLAALWSTGMLVYDLITAQGVSNDADELLATGAVVWLGNNLAFGLLYWLLDSGGPMARARRPGAPTDFAFTQHMNPELAPPGWRPVFLDYLHLGFTNATAFSPTDVMPLSLRAKYAMLVQATVAIAVFGLVVARAVNAFT